MQSQHLPNLTGTSGTPSGGVSPTIFEAHSDQSLWTRLLVPGSFLPFSHTDANLGGKIEFVTTVDVTGELSRGAEDLALLRLACIYVVGRLYGKALVDTFQAIVDQYRWQMDQTTTVPAISSSQRIDVAKVREAQRLLFIFNEE
jgi:hypothetical protein